MKGKNDFKIREYHVAMVFLSEFGGYEIENLKTFTSLSEAVKYARWCKAGDRGGDYRVLGDFNYEEI